MLLSQQGERCFHVIGRDIVQQEAKTFLSKALRRQLLACRFFQQLLHRQTAAVFA